MAGWISTRRLSASMLGLDNYATLGMLFTTAFFILTPFTWHSLRASCASWVAESDGVLEAARRLGHSRSSITTRHYAHPLAGGDRVVADRLDQARKEARRSSTPGETEIGGARVGHEAHDRPDRAVAPDSEKGL